MFIALALAQLLTLWRVRTHPSASMAAACGVAGGALLYTHMGGILFIGAALAMLARDYVRGQRKQDSMAWLAMAITLALFVPYAPIARAQSATLIADHWLDWIGAAYEYPLEIRIISVAGAAAVAAWFVFGSASESDSDDRLRWLGAWTILPGLALGLGSIAIRPMFNLRYVAPWQLWRC
jgi:4-amino-4-deoxy-L-arabinose transferase-like glycosyltransferase